MDELYFSKLLDLATEIDNGRVAQKIFNGLNYKTLMRLAKQELMYYKSGTDPESTQSGREMLKTLDVIKSKLGDTPSRDKLQTIMYEDRRPVNVKYADFLKSDVMSTAFLQAELPAEYEFENEMSYQDFINQTPIGKYKTSKAAADAYYKEYKKALLDFEKTIKR